MAQSIQTSKFGTLDTSGRVPVYFAGKEGDAAPLNMGLSFDVGGKSYVFIPEDRITKGATSGDQGRAYVGFLNPDLLSSLKNNSEYVDIAGSQFGSFDAGKFISDQMGGSTKGYLTTTEVATPIINAGVSEFNPQLTGQLKGIGSYQGQPVYYGDKGYIEPSGRYNYQEKTGQKIIGYTYSSGGGLLAGLGREIVKAGPILPLALDVIGAAYGLPGIGTAVAGGITAGAIASGDEKTATNYAAQYAAGQLGVGSAVAGATGSTVAGQVAQGTAGGLLAGKTPEQAVTGAVKGVALDSLRPDSGVTVPTEQQVLAGQQDLQNQLAPFEVDTTASSFDTKDIINDGSGFTPPTPTPQTPITGNTGGNMATYDDEMNAPAIEMQDTTPYNFTPEEQQLIYQLGMEQGNTQYYDDPTGGAGGMGTNQNPSMYGNLTVGQLQRLLGAGGGGARQPATQSALQRLLSGFTGRQPSLQLGSAAGQLGNLLGGAVGGVGGILAGQTAAKASEEQARMISEATGRAVPGAQFRPIGTTTRFGTSQFQVDPTTGQLTSAGYQLTPELKAMQDRVMALTGQGLTEAEQAAGRYAPLTAGAQGLFGLGQQYLAQSPEQVAADYMARQQDLLAPSRERQLAQLQTQLFNTGRGGLSVGGTGMRPGGGQGLRAASPEMEAYYNALAQQDAQLAAGAQQAGQQQVQFGAGLMGTGANLLGAYGQGLTGAYAPFSTGIGVGSSLEQLGQQPLSLSQQLAQLSSTAGARAGELGIRGTTAASVARLPSMQYNPLARALVGAGGNTQFGGVLGEFVGGALPGLFGAGTTINPLRTDEFGMIEPLTPEEQQAQDAALKNYQDQAAAYRARGGQGVYIPGVTG